MDLSTAARIASAEMCCLRRKSIVLESQWLVASVRSARIPEGDFLRRVAGGPPGVCSRRRPARSWAAVAEAQALGGQPLSVRIAMGGVP